MLKVALCIAAGALARTESRGAHFREDYPKRDDRAWLSRTLAIWRNPEATLPEFEYQPLDIMTMELPPGWRGYGARNHIDHPDTAVRAEKVSEIRERMAGGDRHDLQSALMPYEHLLPERYRGRNERIDEVQE